MERCAPPMSCEGIAQAQATRRDAMPTESPSETPSRHDVTMSRRSARNPSGKHSVDPTTIGFATGMELADRRAPCQARNPRLRSVVERTTVRPIPYHAAHATRRCMAPKKGGQHRVHRRIVSCGERLVPLGNSCETSHHAIHTDSTSWSGNDRFSGGANARTC
jgi:hypothetical protein